MMRRCKKQCEPEKYRKKRNVDYFSYLPDDILLNILLLLPSELLRFKLKYICKRWFNVITTKILYDQASLIIQKPTNEGEYFYGARLVDITEGKLNLRMKEQVLDLPCKGRIRSWCNELLLITDPINLGSIYIFNLITKEGLVLPQCSSYCSGHVGCKCGLGLTFDKFKGAYKVVHVFIGLNSIQCEILVLKGGDMLSSSSCSAWKKISGPNYTGQRQYYWEDPVSVEGRYLHWHVHSPEYIVSMDVVKERFRQTRLPVHAGLCPVYSFVEMGSVLCFLLTVSGTQVDMWVLKDCQRTTWEKVQSIRNLSYFASKVYPGRTHPVPIGSLKNCSNIIFKKRGTELGLYAYNLKFDRMEKLEISLAANERCLVQSGASGFY